MPQQKAKEKNRKIETEKKIDKKSFILTPAINVRNKGRRRAQGTGAGA